MIDPHKPDFDNTPASPRRPPFRYAPADASAPPQVTILTPYWNHARELFHETARCVLAQSFQQWEWLIVDDAASDPQALAVLDQYRGCDPRVRIIDNERNLGLAGARNVGFRAAAAEYVMLLDDDDLLDPTAVEKLYWFLESHPECAMASGWSVGFGAREYLWPNGFERGPEILIANCITGRAMVHKAAWQRVGGYDEAIRGGMEDWDFWLRLADAGEWGASIPEYLDWYRRRAGHDDRWTNLDRRAGRRAFQFRLRAKYARLYEGAFPRVAPYAPEPREDLPCVNRLAQSGPRGLVIARSAAREDVSPFTPEVTRELTRAGWEITLAALTGDMSHLAAHAQYTPDVFVLANFLPAGHQPAFLRYLVNSREHAVVVSPDAQLATAIFPYLRAHRPGPAYVEPSEIASVPQRTLVSALSKAAEHRPSASGAETPDVIQAFRTAIEFAGSVQLFDVQERMRTLVQLQYIERSRLWHGLEHLQLWADRARSANETPEARLARIRAGGSYRLVRSLRRSRAYRWYARRRHGPTYVDLW